MKNRSNLKLYIFFHLFFVVYIILSYIGKRTIPFFGATDDSIVTFVGIQGRALDGVIVANIVFVIYKLYAYIKLKFVKK